MTLALYIMGGAVIALAIAFIWESILLERALKELATLTGEKLGQILAHVRITDTWDELPDWGDFPGPADIIDEERAERDCE